MGFIKDFIKYAQKICWLVLTTTLLLVGCKDEKVTTIPTITYYSPQYLQEFTVADTIDIHALITDDVPVTLVKVNITNEDFIPVSASMIFSPNATSWELSTRIPIEDESLETGSYYTLIRAENGTTYKNQYQEIIIRGLEREFKQLLVITEGGFNEFKVWGSADLDSIEIECIWIERSGRDGEIVIAQHQYRCLMLLRQIERTPAADETLLVGARSEQTARELTLGGMQHEQHVSLLVPRGKTRGWPRTLGVVDDHRRLRDTGQPQGLYHQGKATT